MYSVGVCTVWVRVYSVGVCVTQWETLIAASVLYNTQGCLLLFGILVVAICTLQLI